METTSGRAMLVEPRDLDAEFAAVTATIPRSEVEAALNADEPMELYLDLVRPASDTAAAEERRLSVAWERADLERLLADARSEAITFSFAHNDLERAFEDPDVEGHGLRERALILTVAAAAAGAAAGGAAAKVAEAPGGLGTTPVAVQVSHDEALTAGQVQVGPANDEATLASRGIQATAAHDEATLAARGIDSPAAVRDEATLAARGIEVAPGPARDEATLVARGIEVQQPPAVRDEATLAARGIQPPTPADTGSGFDLPTVDATTAAVSGGIAGGIALLITAAGFTARRGRGIRPA